MRSRQPLRAATGRDPHSRAARNTLAVVVSIRSVAASAPFARVAVELLGHVDDPTGVGDEVRGVEDPPLRECVVHLVGFELVVRAATDDLAAQCPDRLRRSRRDPSAHGARTSHGSVTASSTGTASTPTVRTSSRTAPLVDVGDRDRRPVTHEQLCERGADLPRPLHHDVAVAQRRVAPSSRSPRRASRRARPRR